MSEINLKKVLQDHGVVGAGGAGFPSYAKLAAGADLLVINSAEGEPLIYTDFVLMREKMDHIIDGIRAVMDNSEVKHTYLAVKEHRAVMLGYRDGEELSPGVTVKFLPNVYPMGDEINLIYEATGRLVKPGTLPITSGVIEFNSETAYNICNAVKYNKSVIRKWVTVAGDIDKKYVVNVPIGMKVSDLFARLSITVPETHSVFDGGPSMGRICDTNRAVVTKTTKSLLVLPNHIPATAHKKVAIDDMLRRASSACCGCYRCTDMCPRHSLGYPLEPHKMIRAALSGVVNDAPELVKNATLCCSCGVCTEVCCQDISPKDVILHLKGILAKNKIRFTPDENTEYTPMEERRYRMISSSRWEDILGVKKFDAVPEFINERLMSQKVEIPMSGHIGAPSIPTVSVGDTVNEYDLIAVAADGLSLPQYASISGKVTFVSKDKIVIEA